MIPNSQNNNPDVHKLRSEQNVVCLYDGAALGHKKNKVLIHAKTTDEPRKRSQSQRQRITRFHLYETSGTGKSIETESQLAVT